MNNFIILNYNIWFDNILEKERVDVLVSIISKHQPNIICLQEVKPNIYDILIDKLNNLNYSYFPKELKKSYGCVIFSKHTIINSYIVPFIPYTTMGRELIVCSVRYKNHNINIVTTHFESIFDRNNENTMKLEQFKITYELLNKLYNSYKNIIFCADTNILYSEEHIFDKYNNQHKWLDAWKQTGSNITNKFTFDSTKNMYLKLKNGKYMSRLDRILYKCDNFIINEFSIVKGVDIKKIEPSDHFGIMAKFEIR
jgi:tyrosyl-DNA phosphodiesterase 2